MTCDKYEDIVLEFLKFMNEEKRTSSGIEVKESKYIFQNMVGDSSQKCFFHILENIGKPPVYKKTGMLLLKFPETGPKSDEYFSIDKNPEHMSQVDYFIGNTTFLEKNLNNNSTVTAMTDTVAAVTMPEMYYSDAINRIIILEDVGDTSLFTLLEKNNFKFSKPIEGFYLSLLNWIISLQKINSGVNEILNEISNEILNEISNEILNEISRRRVLEKKGLQAELDEFITWVVNPNFTKASKLFLDLHESFDELTKFIDNLPKGLIHRDFQSKNVMIFNNKPFIIDIQDLCTGPALYDLASLLYDANVLLKNDTQDFLIREFYRGIKQKQTYIRNNDYKDDKEFHRFVFAVQIVGLQRVLKNMGRHSKYALRDGREVSIKYLLKNKKVYRNLIKRLNEQDNSEFSDQFKVEKLIKLLDQII